MSGKTVAGITLILAVINLFALMWLAVFTFENSYTIPLYMFITAVVIAFSASAFGEKKNETR